MTPEGQIATLTKRLEELEQRARSPRVPQAFWWLALLVAGNSILAIYLWQEARASARTLMADTVITKQLVIQESARAGLASERGRGGARKGGATQSVKFQVVNSVYYVKDKENRVSYETAHVDLFLTPSLVGSDTLSQYLAPDSRTPCHHVKVPDSGIVHIDFNRRTETVAKMD